MEPQIQYDYPNTPEKRYNRDNDFRALVDMMHAHIRMCRFTPSEIRDAAVLASIMYEKMTIREIVVPQLPEAVEKILEALHKWEEAWMATDKRAGK